MGVKDDKMLHQYLSWWRRTQEDIQFFENFSVTRDEWIQIKEQQK